MVCEKSIKKVGLSPEKNNQIKMFNKSKEAKFFILR